MRLIKILSMMLYYFLASRGSATFLEDIFHTAAAILSVPSAMSDLLGIFWSSVPPFSDFRGSGQKDHGLAVLIQTEGAVRFLVMGLAGATKAS